MKNIYNRHISDQRRKVTFAILDHLPDPTSPDLHFQSSFCSLHQIIPLHKVDENSQIFPTNNIAKYQPQTALVNSHYHLHNS